jgi:hypothetical protein
MPDAQYIPLVSIGRYIAEMEQGHEVGGKST